MRAALAPVPPVAGSWEAFLLRLDMQITFLQLSQNDGALRIFTVADDYALRYALAYFLIDAWILNPPQLLGSKDLGLAQSSPREDGVRR